jgi:myo-inositol-1(or 4)-monophosphatase
LVRSGAALRRRTARRTGCSTRSAAPGTKSRSDRRERAARFAAAAVRADRWDLRALGTTLSALYVAAGSLLITEAGGVVSDVDGRPWTLDSDSLVGSAHGRLHAELIGLAGR